MAGRGAAPFTLSAPVLLNEVASSTDQTVYPTSASITPTANALVLVWVWTSGGTSPFIPSSVTGNGITFTLVDSLRNQTDLLMDISLWKGSSASPTTGVLNVNFGATKSGCALRVEEWVGSVTPAVKQSKTGQNMNFVTTASLTLNSVPAAGSATAGGFLATNATSFTAGAGFTGHGFLSYTSPTLKGFSEHNLTPSGAVVNCSWATSSYWIALAAEIGAP